MLGTATLLLCATALTAAEPTFDIRIQARGGAERVDVVYEMVGNGNWFRIAKKPERETRKGQLKAADLKELQTLVENTNWKSLPEETSDGKEGTVRYAIRVTQGDRKSTIIRNEDELRGDDKLKLILQTIAKIESQAKSR